MPIPGRTTCLSSVPLCPLSLLTQMLARHIALCLWSHQSIGLSALLSLQLGTCTTILTSRGLLPAPSTLLPSVSLVVNSTVEHRRRRAAGLSHGLTATLSVCLVVGMMASCPSLLKQICHPQHYIFVF